MTQKRSIDSDGESQEHSNKRQANSSNAEKRESTQLFNSTYKYSYMHKTQITTLESFENTSNNIIATGSLDGVVKFWTLDKSFTDMKYRGELGKSKENDERLNEDPGKLEFIKHYQLLKAPVLGFVECKERNKSYIAVLLDFVSVTRTKYPIYIFDLHTFDMITMLELSFKPGAISWAPFSESLCLVVSHLDTTELSVFNVFDDDNNLSKPLISTAKIHRNPIRSMEYVKSLDCLISIDSMSMIEYWQINNDFQHPKNPKLFESKASTDLLSLRKLKLKPLSKLSLSRGEQYFSVVSSDFKVWIFDVLTGKRIQMFDESFSHYEALLNDITNFDQRKRLAAEKEVTQNDLMTKYIRTKFFGDRYIAIPCAIGIKLVEISTGKIASLLGNNENLRFVDLGITVFENNKDITDLNMLVSDVTDGSSFESQKLEYPFMFATAYHSQRVFIFNSTETASDLKTRDIYNEDPTLGSFEAVNSMDPWRQKTKYSNTKVILHTTQGDIKMKMLPRYAPLSVQNFMELCLKNYYKNMTFFKILKGFMIQTGDPNGDGSGGESTWGVPYELELNQEVKHDKPFLVSMAHGGSQFFITSKPAPWLDGKYSIFARVYEGFEVIRAIEETTEEDPVPKLLSTTIDRS